MKPMSQVHTDPDGRAAQELAASTDVSVSLLTGGLDRPYVYGLTKALSSIGIPSTSLAATSLTILRFTTGPE